MIQMNSCEWRKGPLKDVNFRTVADGLISSVFRVIKKTTKILPSFYTNITSVGILKKKKNVSFFADGKGSDIYNIFGLEKRHITLGKWKYFCRNLSWYLMKVGCPHSRDRL